MREVSFEILSYDGKVRQDRGSLWAEEAADGDLPAIEVIECYGQVYLCRLWPDGRRQQESAWLDDDVTGNSPVETLEPRDPEKVLAELAGWLAADPRRDPVIAAVRPPLVARAGA